MTALPSILNGEPRELSLLSRATRLLAEAKSIDEIKDIRDQAAAIRAYLRQRGESLEAQNAAAEIKVRAERRAGELLSVTPMNPGSSWSHDATAINQSLSELGINKSQSSRWQQMAAIDEDDFEDHIAEVKDAGKELTTAGLLRLAQKPRDEPPGAWTLAEATERLDRVVRKQFSFWPVEHRAVMGHMLISLGTDILELGGPRE